MSWSLQYRDLRAFHDERPVYPLDEANQTPETAEQIRAGRAAAAALIESGALGDTLEHDYFVSLSGHANPQHAPTVGWANDSIHLSISQRTAEPD